MSKTLFSFLLSELKTVRILCREKKCGGIFELPIDALFLKRPIECPFCEAKWGDGQNNPLKDLAHILEKLGGMSQLFDVEFVLPGEERK